MNIQLLMILLFVWGIFLGVVFFGGLWLTVKKCLNTELPGLFFAASLFIRLGIVLSGFYLSIENFGIVPGRQPQGNPLHNIILTFAGFFIARAVILRYTKQGGK
jgi:F1F0 ATPase subunit 2